MAALASGILRLMLREILVLVSTPLGTTSDSAGSRSTSSKVSPSMANLLGTPSALSSLVIAGDLPSVVRLALRPCVRFPQAEAVLPMVSGRMRGYGGYRAGSCRTTRCHQTPSRAIQRTPRALLV